MSGRAVGRLAANNSALFVCDLQEKFRTNIQHFDAVVANAGRLVAAFGVMKLPIVATEQYPKGLGPTVQELDLKAHGVSAVAKTQFSMCVPEVLAELTRTERKAVVLCGIECHVCVQQTALQLLQEGTDVHVVCDAVSSRSTTDRMLGLERLRQSGAFLTSTEAVVLALAGGSAHPHFRALQRIIMTPSHDTGLFPHLTK